MECRNGCLHFRSKEISPRKRDGPLVHTGAGARTGVAQLSLWAPFFLTHSSFTCPFPSKVQRPMKEVPTSTNTSLKTGLPHSAINCGWKHLFIEMLAASCHLCSPPLFLFNLFLKRLKIQEIFYQDKTEAVNQGITLMQNYFFHVVWWRMEHLASLLSTFSCEMKTTYHQERNMNEKLTSSQSSLK